MLLRTSTLLTGGAGPEGFKFPFCWPVWDNCSALVYASTWATWKEEMCTMILVLSARWGRVVTWRPWLQSNHSLLTSDPVPRPLSPPSAPWRPSALPLTPSWGLVASSKTCRQTVTRQLTENWTKQPEVESDVHKLVPFNLMFHFPEFHYIISKWNVTPE